MIHSYFNYDHGQITVRNSKRIEWIDFAKGLVMLLVIIGHTVSKQTMPHFLIYSFHMPLFFVFTAMTSRVSDSWAAFFQRIRKSFYQLIVPAFFVWLIHDILYYVVHSREIEDFFRFVAERLLMFFWASGGEISYGSFNVAGLGMLWFLFAMFLGRAIYDLIQWKLSRRIQVFTCIALGIMGVAIGQALPLPMSLDCALAVQPFFLLGSFIKKRLDSISIRTLVMSALLWIALLCVSYALIRWEAIDTACRVYPLFPLCYLLAAAGTVMMCALCKLLQNYSQYIYIYMPICGLGRYSLWLLCIHYLDGIWKTYYSRTSLVTVHVVLRIVIDLMVLFFAVKTHSFIQKKTSERSVSND